MQDPAAAEFSGVCGVLVDPSCSGSGMVGQWSGDVPGRAADEEDQASRLRQLQAFQVAAVSHAMRFPAVFRVVYSTCSVHAEENEGVVARVLEANEAFELAMALPQWYRRGWPGPDSGAAPDAVAAGASEDHDRDQDQGQGQGQEERLPWAQWAQNVVRVSPEHDRTNGFFVAVFERR